MMSNFSTTIDIEAPPTVVWGVMMQIEQWPEWTDSIDSVRQLDPGPLEVGTRARVKQPGFPPTVWEVTEVEEGRSFIWVANGPGARVLARHLVEPRDGGSRVTLSLRFTGTIGPLIGRLTRDINNRYLEYEAEGLKRRSEERARDRSGSL